MFSCEDVTLRPLEREDEALLYQWHLDIGLDIYSGWERKLSRAAFGQKFEQKLTEARNDLLVFGIETDGKLVGTIMLGLIDQENRRAALGIVIGDRTVWGRGVGKKAVRILLDYAFTVKNLEKVFSEVYGFNTRSRRLMESAGFQQEGILRQHEIHNGMRQDMVQYGILKAEFTASDTLYRLRTLRGWRGVAD